MAPYQPAATVAGPAYGPGFKLGATVVTSAIAVRFPLLHYNWVLNLILLASTAMLGLSYYWFLRSTTTIDAGGIRQTWLYDKKVEWSDVRGAKMIGIPYFSWLFPPRLVVRTGVAFTTFNGGSQEVLVEFAKISLAYQMKR